MRSPWALAMFAEPPGHTTKSGTEGSNLRGMPRAREARERRCFLGKRMEAPAISGVVHAIRAALELLDPANESVALGVPTRAADALLEKLQVALRMPGPV